MASHSARPAWADSHELLRLYYEDEWGSAIKDEVGLYELMCLEIFQIGLSWLTILKKRDALRVAFSGFDPDLVAQYGKAEVEALLEDSSIIRNRRKIGAVITNARATQRLRGDGGLVGLVWSFAAESGLSADEPQIDVPRASGRMQSARSVALSKALHDREFTMVGPTSMYWLMEAIGMDPAAGMSSVAGMGPAANRALLDGNQVPILGGGVPVGGSRAS
ncbi:DNA-3-methyladenine glycosylase I [Changpingibacter yushuensis]|uniref:DNA-3-methyladenine glycosylase I n=1 Tax=Changpingibacter yushuensis TaxID=2758440 RepID=UPI00165DEC61|nr:DNA-3-methyladenine glycosylase I [Changpingibacter yushuensis]